MFRGVDPPIHQVEAAVVFGLVATRKGLAGTRNVAGLVVVPARRGKATGRRKPVKSVLLVGKAPALLGARAPPRSPAPDAASDVHQAMGGLGLDARWPGRAAPPGTSPPLALPRDAPPKLDTA